ncbi:CLUMA_CG005051, isoform A [Clunio marinus]|uniref:CLUMA_CG005051, isoform A n=1 Tax=Clunio marinus TaxID=568069 RepID=A0A1J1HV08_9DIPT|nr:CLUMA_CG005051, isoform A [Clunio marinus]
MKEFVKDLSYSHIEHSLFVPTCHEKHLLLDDKELTYTPVAFIDFYTIRNKTKKANPRKKELLGKDLIVLRLEVQFIIPKACPLP